MRTLVCATERQHTSVYVALYCTLCILNHSRDQSSQWFTSSTWQKYPCISMRNMGLQICLEMANSKAIQLCFSLDNKKRYYFKQHLRIVEPLIRRVLKIVKHGRIWIGMQDEAAKSGKSINRFLQANNDNLKNR